jgi:hypothetical protein
VDHADGLDFIVLVGLEAFADRGGVGTVAPIAGDELGAQAKPFRELFPERREMTRF